MTISTIRSAAVQARNLEAALALAALGLKVFPCSPTPDRTPFIKWGKGASANPAEIRGWWRKWPHALPCLPTGPVNGLSVIDLDEKNGKHGIAAWRDLGHDPDAAGLVVETTTGGRHLYFHDSTGVAPTNAGDIAPGVDSRGAGGFVIAPDAVLPDGRSYRILSGDLESVAIGLAPDYPAHVAGRRKAKDTPTPEAGDTPAKASEAACLIARARLAAAKMEVAEAGAGTRSDTLNAAAFEMGRLVGAGALSERTVVAALVAASEANGHVTDDGEGAIRKTIQSGLRSGKLDPARPITADDFDPAPEGEDYPEAEPAAKCSRLAFLSPDDCAALPVREYLVKGLIGPGQVGAIFGDPGAGKSVIAPRLAYAIAQGQEVFGLRTRQGGAFYVACEDESGMAGRVAALRADFGPAPGFQLVTGCADLFSPGLFAGKGSPDLEALRAAVKAERPKLIVIDTLAMGMPGLEENDAAGMNRVVQIGKALARFGAAVIFIHHGTKAEGNTPRGHSVFNGALDFSIQVKAADQSGIVRGQVRKNRNGPADLGIAFRIGTRQVGVDSDGDAVNAPICEPCDPQEADAGPRLKPTERAALDVLVTLAGETGETTEAAWRVAAVDGLTISASDSKDNRRRVAAAALRGLAQKGLIEADGGVIRLTSISSVAGKFDAGEDDAGAQDGADWPDRIRAGSIRINPAG